MYIINNYMYIINNLWLLNFGKINKIWLKRFDFAAIIGKNFQIFKHFVINVWSFGLELNLFWASIPFWTESIVGMLGLGLGWPRSKYNQRNFYCSKNWSRSGMLCYVGSPRYDWKQHERILVLHKKHCLHSHGKKYHMTINEFWLVTAID